MIRTESSNNPYNKFQSRHLNDSFKNFNGFFFVFFLLFYRVVQLLFSFSLNPQIKELWNWLSVFCISLVSIVIFIIIYWLLVWSVASSQLQFVALFTPFVYTFLLLINITFPILKSKRILTVTCWSGKQCSVGHV